MANLGLRAMYEGVDNVMSAFDSLRGQNPYYSVWYGGNISYQYSGDDLDQGRELLCQMLTAMEQRGNTDILVIKFHPKPKGGYITSKSEVIGSLPIRACEIETNAISGIEPSSNGMLAAPVYNMFKKISDGLDTLAESSNKALADRLGALELKALEPVPAAEPEKDWFDRIAMILEKPGVTDLLLKTISMIPISGISQSNMQVAGVDPLPQNNAMPAGNVQDLIAEKSDIGHGEKVPGVIADSSDTSGDFTDEQNLIIDNAITDLSEYCDVVEVLPKLVAYARSNQDFFKQLIKMLG